MKTVCLALALLSLPAAADAAEDYLAELANPGQLAWQETQPWWPAKLAAMEQQLGQPNLAWQMTQPWWPNKLRQLIVDEAAAAPNASTLIFAPTSFWYTPIPTNVTLDPNSANYVAEFQRQVSAYYQNVTINTDVWSSPIYTPTSTTPTTRVQVWDCQNKGYLDAGLQAQWSAVPIPSYAAIPDDSDAEISVYQPVTHTLWEFWVTQDQSGAWRACWGGQIANTNQNPGYFSGGYGATATGLPLIGGQITAAELQAGVINHVIGISLVDTAAYSVVSWPAQRSDGYNPTNAPNRIAEGTRFRLDPTIDVSTLPMSPLGKIIAKAAQTYGFVVWDKAGSISLRAENSLSYTALGLPSPYTALFNGTPSYAVLNGFPWQNLQFLPMNYGKP